LLKRLISNGFKVIFSCVKKPWFTEDWVGRLLDMKTLGLLAANSADTGLDMCGENGEYHTLVLDGPPFKKSIRIESSSIRRDGSLTYLEIHDVALCDKGSSLQTRQTT
jgi:diphthamide synthase (EF-2-diphthine--ammonia ligase)